MIVGLAVMGFGAGSLIFAPLLESLIGSDPTMFAESIPRTFIIMAVVFYVFVIGAAQIYRVPPAGWKPEGWEPPAAAAGAGVKQDFSPGEMLRTWQFYALWILYAFGTSIGFVAIGQASPIIREIAAEGALLTGGAALGVMSFFNGIGRLSWGSLSDKIGRNTTTVAMYAVYFVACLFLLRSASGFWPVLIGLCMVGLRLWRLPRAVTFIYRGLFRRHERRRELRNRLYGLWSVRLLRPGYFAGVMDKARAAGDLAAGYNEVYVTLTVFAVVGAMLALMVRKPAQTT